MHKTRQRVTVRAIIHSALDIINVQASGEILVTFPLPLPLAMISRLTEGKEYFLLEEKTLPEI